MPVLVEITDVCKHFVKGDETITPLDGVCLTIEQGEFISLMGASGCGKSTLLRIIDGLIDAGFRTIVPDQIAVSQSARER